MIVSLSGIIIPLILFMILLYGMISKKEMYQPFLEGVQDGFKVVMEIAPTLIALFLAVQIFRTSGALDLLVSVLSPVGQLLKIPKDVLCLLYTSEHMERYLGKGLSQKEAMKLVAKDRGVGKRDIYQELLRYKK